MSLDQATGTSTRTALAVERLSTGYGDARVVEDVSFDIPAGSLVAVLGPNGSGKSTLLKALIGLLPAMTGSISIFGQRPAAARERIGYVPQSSDVQWDFPVTVREVVGMGLYRHAWGLRRFRRPPRDLVDRALGRVDALALAPRQPGELSGGQRRRVLIARALIRDPDLLLLDEPAAGLDQPAEEELIALLRGLSDSGKTVIVATHDIAGAYETFDLALLLNRRVIAFGPARDTLTDPVLHETFGRQLLSFHGHHRHDIELHRHEDT